MLFLWGVLSAPTAAEGLLFHGLLFPPSVTACFPPAFLLRITSAFLTFLPPLSVSSQANFTSLRAGGKMKKRLTWGKKHCIWRATAWLIGQENSSTPWVQFWLLCVPSDCPICPSKPLWWPDKLHGHALWTCYPRHAYCFLSFCLTLSLFCSGCLFLLHGLAMWLALT